MAIAKISEVGLEFPVVGFSRDQGLLWFDDLALLTHCSAEHIENQTFIGMEMFDNRLRRWIVRSLDLKEPLKPKPNRWWQIFASRPYGAFELRLEELEPIEFAALKTRLLAEMEVEDPEDEAAARQAPDLATFAEATYTQCSGLL